LQFITADQKGRAGASWNLADGISMFEAFASGESH